MNKTVAGYLPLMDFLETVLGPTSEIALHDLTDPDHSLVAIKNSGISGRSVGAPATDLAIKVLQGAYRDRTFISGYRAHGADGRQLRAASFIIREGDACVGMLCVNTDLSLIDRLESVTAQLAAAFGAASAAEGADDPASAVSAISDIGAHEMESLTDSTSELIARNIENLAQARGMSVADLTQADRIDIIRTLNANGLFLLKGAVASCAETMGVSEPSVYRYLQKVRKE